MFLLGEIAVLGHARELHHATQRDLAPAAAHFGTAQRRGEIAGLALQEVLHLHEVFDLARELARGFAAFAFAGLRCSSCRASATLSGSTSCLMASSRSLSVALADRLVAPEDFARELEEGFAVGIQRQARSAFDGRAHLRLALAQQFRGARAQLALGGDLARACRRALR